jgi:hypothetical protein
MRDKVFSVLHEDIQKLPKSWSKGWSEPTQVRYIHALSVVLYTIVYQRDWIENKVYSSDDFKPVFDATARVQNVVSLLMRDRIFDDEKMYKVFISYHKYIQKIDEMNNQWERMFEEEGIKKMRFFTPMFLTKLSSMEKSMIAKCGEEEGVKEGVQVEKEEEKVKEEEGEEEAGDKKGDISCIDINIYTY